jgi:hypothetical protein
MNLILACESIGIIYYEYDQNNIDSDRYILYFSNLLKYFPKEKLKSTIFDMDNTTCHKSKKTKKFFKEYQLKILYGSPYKSCFDFAEKIFMELKNFLYRTNNLTYILILIIIFLLGII